MNPTAGTGVDLDTAELRITDAPRGVIVRNLSSPFGIVFERDAESNDRTIPEKWRQPESRSQFACFMSTYRSNAKGGKGYYYRSAILHFPKEVTEEADGSAVVLRFEARSEQVRHPSKVSRLVVCRVPHTRRAVEMSKKALGLAGESPATRLGDRSSASASGRAAPRPFGGPGNVFKSQPDDEPLLYLPRLSGWIRNSEGATCLPGYDWANDKQTLCTNGYTLQLPEIIIEHDMASRSGGASGRSASEPDDSRARGYTGPYHTASPRDGAEGGAAIPLLWDDMHASEDIDCTEPYTTASQLADCTAVAPAGGMRLFRTTGALIRIRNRGGECVAIANMGREMLKRKKIRYFYDDPEDEFDLKWGYGSRGQLHDADDWISIDAIFVLKYYNQDRMNNGMWYLDWILVHEIEHFMGRSHVDAYGNSIGNADSPWTLNAKKCSGLE